MLGNCLTSNFHLYSGSVNFFSITVLSHDLYMYTASILLCRNFSVIRNSMKVTSFHINIFVHHRLHIKCLRLELTPKCIVNVSMFSETDAFV